MRDNGFRFAYIDAFAGTGYRTKTKASSQAQYLKDLCQNRNWKNNRAVLFLDPYGMQVTWDTIKAIAATNAIDLWILFPLGIGVNRMTPRRGKISDAWRKKLDN